jgi:hypothetical protein
VSSTVEPALCNIASLGVADMGRNIAIALVDDDRVTSGSKSPETIEVEVDPERRASP